MTGLVEDAKKWVKVMKEKDKADVIVAVAHTGEKPKNQDTQEIEYKI
ncbi:hypothetical protein Q5M85_01995 [Paraclostridium bifermentans]|nr:hypothetical protein [Paraclostridium bifermentans]